MKKFIISLVGMIVLCLAANSVIAQPPGGRAPGRGPDRGVAGRYMPTVPVLAALDTNGDGEISAAEIKGASVALLKLDKNRDGKLTEDEVRPGGSGRGDEDRRPPRPGDRDRSPRPGDRGGPPRPHSDRQQDVNQSVNRLMVFDKDKDGKLAKDELPERMQAVLTRADSNKDGFATREELTKMFTGRGPRGPSREGGRPQVPDRPRSD